MKIIKTGKQSILYRIFESGASYYLAVTVLQFFAYNRPGLLPEAELWESLAGELGQNAVLDMGMPKPRGEVLLAGKCHTPNGRPAKACPVRLKIGPVDKELHVFGGRHWKTGLMETKIAGYEDFTSMDLDWKNAFGGPQYPRNPLGLGHRPVKTPDGKSSHPLPHIEDPKNLVLSPKDHPDPAGFGPIDLTWPQRMSKAGTYDREWFETSFPQYARDMDPTFFNAAPPDQWIQKFWNGDETFALHHVHPERPVIEGRLPGFRPRIFINRETGNEDSHGTETVFQEIKTRLETVWFFPERLRGLLIHRGAVEIGSDDARDVLHLMAGYEEILHEPNTFEHYRREFEKRSDENQAFLYFLKDKGLVPESEAVRRMDGDQPEQSGDIENRMAERARKKALKEMEKARASLAGMGLDPDEFMPEPPAPAPKISLDEIDPDEIEKIIADAQKQAETKKAEALERLKAMCARFGLNHENVMAKAQAGSLMRLPFSADDIIAKMKRFGAVIRPELEEKLRAGEKHFKEAYKKTVHLSSPPPGPAPGKSAALRDRFLDLREKGRSLTGLDLAGIDLSGLDLSDLDLREVLLEGADLTGTDLSGADLSGAVLAHARMNGVRLCRTRLVQTNLGAADLTRADLTEADLTNGILSRADLTEADLTAARLGGVEFLETRFKNTRLKNADLQAAMLLDLDLTGSDFSGADLTEAVMTSPILHGADFTSCRAVGTIIVQARAKNAVFKNADMTNVRLTQEAILTGADFSGAVLNQANLMEADLTGANLVKAKLNEANCIKTILQEADLTGAVARRANFIEADFTRAKMIGLDLMEANLMKARLTRADLRLASLYGAELMKVVVGETDFGRANLKKTKLAKWGPK